jgi:alpha-glucosidase
MESRKSERAPHDATVPFTRLLAGPADYTPVHFGERRNDTTWAHQIATAIVMTSGLLTYGAHPKSLLENPAADLIRAIPAVWDETRVLPGSEIGELALITRRSGATWFIACVNGRTAKTVRVDLSFLPPGKYAALSVRDVHGNSAAVDVKREDVHRATPVAIETAAGGGFVIRLSR